MKNKKTDHFTGGVLPGGLRGIMDIKILICYLINALNTPFTRAEINTVIQEEGMANYFMTNSAIDDLLAKDNLKQNENGELSVTRSGQHIAEQLDVDLPRSVRNNVVSAAIRLKTRLKREHENKIEIVKREKDYTISFTIFDMDEEMMVLTLAVADLLQAEELKQNFLNDPQKVYASIVRMLAENKQKNDKI